MTALNAFLNPSRSGLSGKGSCRGGDRLDLARCGASAAYLGGGKSYG